MRPILRGARAGRKKCFFKRLFPVAEKELTRHCAGIKAVIVDGGRRSAKLVTDAAVIIARGSPGGHGNSDGANPMLRVHDHQVGAQLATVIPPFAGPAGCIAASCRARKHYRSIARLRGKEGRLHWKI